MKRIKRVPKHLLPEGPARDVLLRMAEGGLDVDAYTPLQIDIPEHNKRWNIWADGRRWTTDEWLEYCDWMLGK